MLSIGRLVDAEEIKKRRAFNHRWYYNLELAPGLFTPGRDHRAVAQTRNLLRRVDIESGGADGGGARCLDVGIQEAMITLLLDRRGGSEVVGYDRVLRQARLNLVREALKPDFKLIGGMKLADLPAALAEERYDPFDVVVFSGVLYHMFDPLGGLAIVRGLVRNGGICLVETTVALDDSDAMHFNRAGRFTPRGLWFVTPRLLEYLLRFLRLKPLDVVHVPGAAAEDGKPAQGRIAIACRAVPDPVGEPGDAWILRTKGHDFDEFLSWDAVDSTAPDVVYDDSRKGIVHGDDGRLDVEASIDATEPLETGPDATRLALDARH
jgi:SAM-dependent methyltransferase